MATVSVDNPEEKKLSEMFDDAFKLFNSFDTCQDPMNDTSVQANIKRCMHLLEDTTRLVSAADMFSANEGLEEVPTEHLRYLLLPALLGELSLKLCGGNRSEIVNCADVYFKDFLKRATEYGLFENQSSTALATTNSNSGQHVQLAAMVGSRNAKLQKFREQKELENRLKVLQETLDSEYADEEIRRDYYITTIKMYIMKAQDELNSLAMEKQILEHMEKVKGDGGSSRNDAQPRRKGPPPKPLKPVIITRDEVQKAVYGAGYPSLPTFTVQEFYDQRIKDGVFPDPTKPLPSNAPKALQQMTEEDVEQEQLKAEEEKDLKEETEDEESIMRARAMDEYKDDHRTGWGNRYNRS